ncbi:hypothetical protein COOONC_24834 [Cooperia oncophora]
MASALTDVDVLRNGNGGGVVLVAADEADHVSVDAVRQKIAADVVAAASVGEADLAIAIANVVDRASVDAVDRENVDVLASAGAVAQTIASVRVMTAAQSVDGTEAPVERGGVGRHHRLEEYRRVL